MAKYSKGAKKNVTSANKESQKGKTKTSSQGKKLTDPRPSVGKGFAEAKKNSAKVIAKPTASKKSIAKKSTSRKSAPRKAVAKTLIAKNIAPKKAAAKKGASRTEAPKKVAGKTPPAKKYTPVSTAAKKDAPKKLVPKKTVGNSVRAKTKRGPFTKPNLAKKNEKNSLPKDSTDQKRVVAKQKLIPKKDRPTGFVNDLNIETSITNESDLPPVEEQSNYIHQKGGDSTSPDSEINDVLGVETDDIGINPIAEM